MEYKLMSRRDYSVLTSLEKMYPNYCPFIDLICGFKPSFLRRRQLKRLLQRGWIEKNSYEESWCITLKGIEALKEERCHS